MKVRRERVLLKQQAGKSRPSGGCKMAEWWRQVPRHFGGLIKSPLVLLRGECPGQEVYQVPCDGVNTFVHRYSIKALGMCVHVCTTEYIFMCGQR